MENRFDEFWSVLDSRKLTGDELRRQASELVRNGERAEAGFQVSDGPCVVLWVKEPDRLRFLVEIQSEAPYFVGHFPGNPILPGIIQLHWAVLLARRCGGFDDSSVDVKRVKFRSIITPPRLVELRLEPMGGGWVDFSLIGKAGIHSLGSLVFPESS